jgi:hypothetical protein
MHSIVNNSFEVSKLRVIASVESKILHDLIVENQSRSRIEILLSLGIFAIIGTQTVT